MSQFCLGDMLVTDTPPPKLLKALAVIARYLHETLEQMPGLAYPGKTRESCVLASLTVRDFLRRLDFDAHCRTVAVVLQAVQGNEVLHCATVGHPNDKRAIDGRWSGHLVVLVDGLLIDTTLYQVNRPAWSHLPGMIAIQYERSVEPVLLKRHSLALLDWVDAADYRFGMVWLDNEKNRAWKAGPDAQKDRRKFAVDALTNKFGRWRYAYPSPKFSPGEHDRSSAGTDGS